MIRPDFFFFHGGDHRLAEKHIAHEVDAEDFVPVGLGVLHKGLFQGQDAGVVDQHVHRTEPFQHLLHGDVDLFLLGDVALHGHGVRAILPGQLLGGCDGGLLVDVHNGHPHSILHQPRGDGLADALGCPGHDRCLAHKRHENLLLLSLRPVPLPRPEGFPRRSPPFKAGTGNRDWNGLKTAPDRSSAPAPRPGGRSCWPSGGPAR